MQWGARTPPQGGGRVWRWLPTGSGGRRWCGVRVLGATRGRGREFEWAGVRRPPARPPARPRVCVCVCVRAKQVSLLLAADAVERL